MIAFGIYLTSKHLLANHLAVFTFAADAMDMKLFIREKAWLMR